MSDFLKQFNKLKFQNGRNTTIHFNREQYSIASYFMIFD